MGLRLKEAKGKWLRLKEDKSDEEVWVNPTQIVTMERVGSQTKLTLTSTIHSAGSVHLRNKVISVSETPKQIVEKQETWHHVMTRVQGIIRLIETGGRLVERFFKQRLQHKTPWFSLSLGRPFDQRL